MVWKTCVSTADALGLWQRSWTWLYLPYCNVKLSGKVLCWPIEYILCKHTFLLPFSVMWTIIVSKDKMNIAAQTFLSCKMLSHSIINCCTVFWWLINLQTNWSVTTKLLLVCLHTSQQYFFLFVVSEREKKSEMICYPCVRAPPALCDHPHYVLMLRNSPFSSSHLHISLFLLSDESASVKCDGGS